MTPNDYQQAALRTAPGDLPPKRILPVSYTHLDVYKRQPSEECRTCPFPCDKRKN